MPLWNYHKNAAKEFIFSTERPLTIMFGGFVMEYLSWTRLKQIHCGVPVIYRLDEGKDYEVNFEMDPEKYQFAAENNNGVWVARYEMDKVDCTASIFEIVEIAPPSFSKTSSGGAIFPGGIYEKRLLKTFSKIGVDSEIIGVFGTSEKEMLDGETSAEGCMEAFHKGSFY
jgi:hypothetical protein